MRRSVSERRHPISSACASAIRRQARLEAAADSRRHRAGFECRAPRFACGRNRRDIAVDPQRFATGFCTSSRSYHRRTARYCGQIDRISLLPFILVLIRAPLDEAGPARQGGEMKAKIFLPEPLERYQVRSDFRAGRPPVAPAGEPVSRRLFLIPLGDHSRSARNFQAV